LIGPASSRPVNSFDEVMTMHMLRAALVALALFAIQPIEARVTGLPDFTDLVAETGPAVVNIRTTQYGQRTRGQDGQADGQPPFEGDVPEYFRRFFEGPNVPRDRQGAGSGFIIDSSGYVVTNHHVIDGADQIIVRMADRREFEAELVGSDAQSDIALLKVDAVNLPTLEFGNSRELEQGEWVMAIGSPFNFDQTVTAGIVSATGRSNNAQQYVPFIQTDVAINRGNSGGPLLNMDGKVVGVNSWILTSGGGYIGLSFSIPAEIVTSTVTQLRETGRVQRGLLGVMVGEVTREMAEAMKLDRPTGALVNDVTSDGAAERAGIVPGDIILSFDEQPVETWNDLPPLVGANPPGTEAEVVVSRDGERRTFDVVLDALEPAEEEELAANDDDDGVSNALGLAVEGVGADRRRELEAPEGGVLVTRVESDAAWRAGLRPGDIILMINSESVDGVDSFEDIVGDIGVGKAVALRVWRDGATTFFAYTPSEEDVG
jgi:serine protease Do